MASTYSQDNVGAGVDTIVSSPANQRVRYSNSQSVSQSVEMEVSLNMLRGVQ